MNINNLFKAMILNQPDCWDWKIVGDEGVMVTWDTLYVGLPTKAFKYTVMGYLKGNSDPRWCMDEDDEVAEIFFWKEDLIPAGYSSYKGE